MTPDIDRAAIAACHTLLEYDISAAPIAPLPILKSLPRVFVVSFTEIAAQTGLDRNSMVMMLGPENQDAQTFVSELDGQLHYFVAYNQRLPFYLLQRGLARELGHIVLGHDGTRPEDVRATEALYFARHLLCPRPLIRLLQSRGVDLTMETVGNLTGCYERCMMGIRKTPGAHVPADLNRLVSALFSDYLDNYLNFHRVISHDDASARADFGTYMDNYMD